ncbi:DUF2332 family protein [Paracoccus aurantiacus]|uniref:DUF2332 family protein n=1 Tax=Paracoccus aurantiacus TaxID=2599412 RepID=A0A5C6S7X0_9RHOB|nr:DUF2332 family protein [Paracoccus aurantiacus]TXB70458.1 DUF2332 family protein [Paracoccus aurantiacus]
MTHIRAAFDDQAQSCRQLGSDLTARIVENLGNILSQDSGAVAAKVRGWHGDISSRGASVPLRLAGALHGLVLDGSAPDLAAAYARGEAPESLLQDAIAAHQVRILDWLNFAPQTNEVGRSAALIAAAAFAVQQLDHSLPLALSELGASAGLNLNFPDYAIEVKGKRIGPAEAPLILRPDWSGSAPMATELTTTVRRGVDLAPLDRSDPLRMRAYIWPDQPDRLARLDAAIAHATTHPPSVERGDAADWLDHVPLAREGALSFVYHTIAFQYFPPETQRRVTARLSRAGAAASSTDPLAHFAMEADNRPGGAALTLDLWAGEHRRWHLGRADFHGRWIDWQPQEL